MYIHIGGDKMRKNNRVKKMIIAALLTAIAIIIPLVFAFLRVNLGPFTATITAHVPIIIAMIISPKVGLVVGLGSTIGFAMTASSVVALRASSHIIVAYVGGVLFKKYNNLKMPLIITAPIHGVLEGLALIPFGLGTKEMIIITCVGTIVHYFIDGFITFVVVKAMAGKTEKNIYEVFLDKFVR